MAINTTPRSASVGDRFFRRVGTVGSFTALRGMTTCAGGDAPPAGGTTRAKELAQIAPFELLHDEERDAVVGDAEIVHLHDVGVSDARERLRLYLHPGHESLAARASPDGAS